MIKRKFLMQKNRVMVSFIIFAILMLTSAAQSLIFSTIAAMIVWSTGMIFCLRDIKRRFALFSFHVGFFVFLFGGVFLSFVTNQGFDYLLGSTEAKIHTLFALVLCLSVVNLVALYFYVPRHSHVDLIVGIRNYIANKNTKKLLLLLTIISYLCELIIEIVVTEYRLSNSYLSLESDVKSQLPVLINLFASIFYISFFTYLATMPSRKNVIKAFLSIAVLESIILVSGERGEPLSVAFVLVFYILIRNKVGIRDIVLRKKHLVAVFLIAPILLTYLQTLASTRVNREYEESRYGAVFDFFETQGKSVTIISRCYDARDAISSIGGNTFVIGEIRNYLSTNLVSRVLFGNEVGTKLEQALSGDKFSATTNYMFLSAYSFSRNVGGGTTYVAQVYHDGGYLFLVIANICLALLMYRIDNLNNKYNFLYIAIEMNILKYIVLIPRGYMLSWLTDTFAIPNIMFLSFILFINRETENDKIVNKIRS